MARSLGELFPVITAVLGVYFLVLTMTTSSVVTTTADLTLAQAADANLPVVRARDLDSSNRDSKWRFTAIAGTSSAPGLYAIASALCFGSVLLWSRLTPQPAPVTAAED